MHISKTMVASRHIDVVPDEDEGEYEKGDTFLSFHRQATQPISQKVMLAGYLSAWLKRYVIPSPPFDGITLRGIFPAIQFVHGKLLGCFLLYFARF